MPGWVNCDQKDGDGIVTSDIRAGLPFESDAFDYAVSIHALPELAYPELLPALAELRRVLKEGGLLRGCPEAVLSDGRPHLGMIPRNSPGFGS